MLSWMVSAMDKKVIYLIFIILLSITLIYAENDLNSGFIDDDKDGIPNSLDICPNSISKIIDVSGCNCQQKNCGGGSCIEVDLAPQCQNNCQDGIKNNDETEIDCGGSCKSCPEVQDSLITDCKNDGCPDGFSCEKDGCIKKVSREGRICKTHNVEYSLSKIDCKTKGTEWIEEDVNKLINIEVSGLVFLDDYVQEEVNEKLKDFTLCINTVDMGCSSSGIKCFGENQLTEENRDKGAKVIKKFIDKETELPWFLDWFIDLDTSVDLTDFKIAIPYSCDDLKLNSKDACKEFIKKGGKNKADVLLIADGYNNDQKIKDILTEILDSEGTNQGFFSEEPFKSNKEKFNFWYLNSNGKINYEKDSYVARFGTQPQISDVVTQADYCPWYDYIVLLSKSKDFRSNCMAGKPGPCRISLANEDFPGRLFTHEFGHMFASLVDEYYNLVESQESTYGFEEFFSEFQTGPNCKKSQSEAESEWGSLTDIEYVNGCGGDCDESCANFVRPTVNSVMRHQNEKCNNENSCLKGPPFDGFYAVNEKEIKKELKKYS